MQLYRFTPVILFVICLGGCGKSNQKERSNWAERDLLFMQNMITIDHPGMVNVEDPDFKKHLSNAFLDAQAQLKITRTDQEKQRALDDFTRSFNDVHLGIFFDDQKVDTQITQQEDSHSFKLKKMAHDTYWITLPTFMISADQRRNFEQIIEQLPALQTVQKIVFDLRGNRGGNSLWGLRIVQALFGKEYYLYRQQQYEQKITIDWRATKANIEHVKKIRQAVIGEFGKKSKEAHQISKIYCGMKEALRRNAPYYNEAMPKVFEKGIVPDPVTANIVAIIDKDCGSACLDFIDELYAMNHAIVLIGQKTAADSVYMDRRDLRLPSNKGIFYFPIKVYRNRPSGNNQPYFPDIQADPKNENELIRRIETLV